MWLDGPDVELSQEVASLVAAAADALGAAGASVREAGPGFDTAEAREVAFQLWVAATASSTDDHQHARAVERAASTPASDQSLPALRVLEEVDVVLVPGVAGARRPARPRA